MKCKKAIRFFLKLVTIFLILLAISNSLHDNNPTIKETGYTYTYAITNLINTNYPGAENYTRYATDRLGMLPLRNVKPLMPELGPVINDVTSFKYPITIPPCGTTNRQSVFIAVISAPENFEKRMKIRQTWKNHINSVYLKGLLDKIHFGFVLGRTENISTQNKIEEENKSYGDILQIEMLDFYRNLPLKMAGLLNWVNTYCSKIDFMVKIDDDMFLNVHALAHFVRSFHQSGKMMIFGDPNKWGPYREGQWKITLEDWPWNRFPSYINGGSYIVHGTAILPLLAAAQTTPLMPFEDVYLTGICAEKAGIQKRYSFGSTSFSRRNLDNICNADNFLAWSGEPSHWSVDNFYRGVGYHQWQCKPNISSQLIFTKDML